MYVVVCSRDLVRAMCFSDWVCFGLVERGLLFSSIVSLELLRRCYRWGFEECLAFL